VVVAARVPIKHAPVNAAGASDYGVRDALTIPGDLMKTAVLMVLAAAVAVTGTALALGGTPARARTPATPPPTYAVTVQLGCAYYPGGGGNRAWIPGPCTDATGSAMVGEPDAYRLTITNRSGRAEPVPDVTVGFYSVYGLIGTAREVLPAGRIGARRAVRPVLQDQPLGTVRVAVLGTARR
jgi:hypothetical protein